MTLQINTQVIVTGAIVGAATIFGYYNYKKYVQNKIPTRWEPIGHVAELYIYPLKSGRRLGIKSAKVTEYGLQSEEPELCNFRDRCLLIYKEGINEYKTAMTHPKILFIETNVVDGNHFSLSVSGMNTLIFEVPKSDQKYKEIVMWNNEKVPTIDCGDEVAEWISTYLLGNSNGLRLGYHDGKHKRNILKYFAEYKKLFPKLDNSVGGMYSDLATALIMTEASVRDLQERLPNSDVSVHNFRPNFVIDGDLQPYTEDEWDWIKIGDVVFRNVMLCGRCALTTINPETAEFSKKYEPITTMRKYRTVTKIGSGPASPTMGIYAGIKLKGIVKLKDTVYVGKH